MAVGDHHTATSAEPRALAILASSAASAMALAIIGTDDPTPSPGV
jgi:hypothetical protein